MGENDYYGEPRSYGGGGCGLGSVCVGTWECREDLPPEVSVTETNWE